MLKKYENKRMALIAQARQMVEAGDLEGSKEITAQIAQLDADFEAKRTAVAELDALNEKGIVNFEPFQTSVDGAVVGTHDSEPKGLSDEVVAFDKHIRSYGKISNEVKTDDVGVLIPEEILYNPELEIKTITDLTTLVDRVVVTTASGKYPILKRATAGLSTVAELEENPALAKPEFLEVSWSVDTYRGAIPVSAEAIDDSQADLMGILARNAREQKINTTNARIAAVLKDFTAKGATGTDDLKTILNVALDPAYVVTIVCTQSFYNEVDKLKDNNGRYLLQDSITAPSGKQLLGRPVVVVADTLLGSAGDTVAFVGDLKRAVLFADRTDISVDWIKHEIYGRYLGVFTRFDVVKADASAGYFVTLGADAG